MTLEEYIEKQRKRVANMTLAQARDLIAKTLSHSDMEIEFDKAVWMLLNCADEKINGGWIPVTERLPEESTAVLVWCPERKNIYCAYYEEKRWWIFGAYWERIEMEIVAWMPLPKPYKGGQKDGNDD